MDLLIQRGFQLKPLRGGIIKESALCIVGLADAAENEFEAKGRIVKAV
jgi:hypothetical protein